MYDANGKLYNTVTSEIWEDNDSDKYKLITKYSDATVVKSYDGTYEYDYDPKGKTLKKTEVVNTTGKALQKRGYRTEMINWLNEILSSKKVSAVESKVDGEEMFIVTVIKNTDDKYVHYFDKNSMTLKDTKIYKIKDGKDVLYQDNTDKSFELIKSASQEEQAGYFKFDVVVPADVKVTLSKIDAVSRKVVL
jgi:hypothetical protein